MNINSTIRFDDNLSLKVLPSMLYRSKQLIHQLECEEGQPYSGASLICAATFSALTAELLLKYRLQQEEKVIPKIHDLYCLYRRLSDETRETVQQNFAQAVSAAQLRIGWDKVESIFQKARHAFEGWRYIIQTREEPLPIIGLRPLHNAATSVLMAIKDDARNQ